MRYKDFLSFIALCFAFSVLSCSTEEPPLPPQRSEVVRKPIDAPSTPAPRPPETMEQEGPGKGRGEAAAGEKAGSAEAAGAEPAPGEAAPHASLRVVASASPGLDGGRGARAEAEAPSPEKGVYTVLPGDSLAVIAGREDVFGDPLKWIILYQFNRELLNGLTLDERLPERPVPEGTRLRYEPGGDRTAGAGAGSDRVWVVNVVSSLTADRIDGPAVQLLKKGCPVYISRARVDGRDWMRLRVGFFKDRESAMSSGRELQEFLGQEDSWPVSIGPEEAEEYAALLRPLYDD
jgi:hypothetical protein